MVYVKAGDKIPTNIELHEGFGPPKVVNIGKYVKGKKVLIVGLPGAFTPTWSTTEVPGYLKAQDALKELGISEVIVYCVNDGAVMKAWAKDQGIEGSMIKFLGDPACTLTKAHGMVMDHPGPVSIGIIGRCKRHAIYADDGEVKYVAVCDDDDDPAGDDYPEETCAPAMMEAIKKL